MESSMFRPIRAFDKTRVSMSPASRLTNVRAAALELRREMLEGPKVAFYETFDLIRVPYPTKYGFLNACSVPTPFLHIVNKMFVIQTQTAAGLKTVLVSPSDTVGNAETPFFKRLSPGEGGLSKIAKKFLAPELGGVESSLKMLGLSPRSIDYITYDHLHTQDLRKWLGTDGRPGLFPNAQLLVMEQEWESAKALLPPQKDWYCPGGLEGIPADRVVKLKTSVMVGDGLALVHTPGHTEGNHSIVAHTDDGLLVTSENGIAPDSYAPHLSEIPGLQAYVRETGMEVVLNGNTLEGGLDQYVSMILEKTLAGPSHRHPGFFNVVSSSELRSYWGFPGIKPTASFGKLKFGALSKSE